MSFVRSKVEYCSVLWSPHNKENMYCLEGVQCRATNYLTNNPRRPSPYHLDYKTRLQICNLLPLSYRKEILDIIFFLKSYHGKTGYDVRRYLAFSDENSRRSTRQSIHGCLLKIRNISVKSKHRNQFYPSRLAIHSKATL